MKIIILLICSFAFISAQSQKLHLSESEEFDNNFVKKTPSPFPPGPQYFKMDVAKWKLISENGKERVYESPIDKMRCIAFDFKSNMPVAGSSLNLNLSRLESLAIPNPILNNPTIPPPLNQK